MPLGGFDAIVDVALDALGLLQGEGDGAGTVITIETVDSDAPAPNKVTLRGRAMPYKGVNFGVEQRTKKRTYPGNPVSTQQVLGAEEQDSTFNGMWKARYLGKSIIIDGDEDTISAPGQADNLFSRMARSGVLYKVKWLHNSRTGILKEFEMEWDQETDANWRMEWEWQSRDEEDANPFKLDVPGFGVGDILGAIDTVLDVIAEGAFVTKQMQAMIVSDIAALQDTVSNLIDNLSQIATILTAPQTIIGAILYNLKELGRQCAELQGRLSGSRLSAATSLATSNAADGTNNDSVRNKTGELKISKAGEDYVDPTAPGASNNSSGLQPAQPAGVPSPTMVQASGGVSDPTDQNLGAIDSGATPSNGVTATAQLETWRRNVALKLTFLYLIAEQVSAAEIARVTQQPNKTIISRSGDTLYSISTRAYGSPDFANFLAQSNKLRNAIIKPGTEIKIPPRPLGAAATIDFTSSGEGVGPAGA